MGVYGGMFWGDFGVWLVSVYSFYDILILCVVVFIGFFNMLSSCYFVGIG